MKTKISVLLIAACAVARAQTIVPVNFETPPVVVVGPGWVSAGGFWGENGHLPQASQVQGSYIICIRGESVCRESTSTVDLIGSAMSVQTGENDYQVSRWNKDEIVASSIQGDCKIRYVLKIDLIGKRVHSSTALSEPMPKKMADGWDCNAGAETKWEL
jgi:hypothetical protein